MPVSALRMTFEFMGSVIEIRALFLVFVLLGVMAG
jgi:hypothetical protein